MNDKEQEQVLEVISQIEKRLDSLEELLYWLIPAKSRFKKGQRVKFSALADRKRISRTKHNVRRGKVVEVSDHFSIKVLLDGYKRPHGYNHMFWDRIGSKNMSTIP